MINRSYVVLLDQVTRGSPNLDIILSLPGSISAPVGVAAYYPGMGVTPAPVGWNGERGVYYEIRNRAVRCESVFGQAGFSYRARLGVHLSVAILQDAAGLGVSHNLVPALSFSQSLTPAPGAGNLSVFGSVYATAFPDPSYGPVIRVWNSPNLFPGTSPTPQVLYLVNLAIEETRDSDLSPVGRG